MLTMEDLDRTLLNDLVSRPEALQHVLELLQMSDDPDAAMVCFEALHKACKEKGIDFGIAVAKSVKNVNEKLSALRSKEPLKFDGGKTLRSAIIFSSG